MSPSPAAKVHFLTESDGGAIHILKFKDQSSFKSFIQTHVIRKKSRKIEQLELALLRHGDIHEEVLLLPLEEPEIHVHGGRANDLAIRQLIAASATESSTTETSSPESSTTKASSLLSLWHEVFRSHRGKRALDYLLKVMPTSHDVQIQASENNANLNDANSLKAHELEGYDFLKPSSIAIVGPPNAGKSTFFNAALGEQRALVSELSGTTRDLIQADILIDDWECQLFDTAGLNPEALQHLKISEDIILGESEKRAIAAVQNADIVLAFRCELPSVMVSAQASVLHVHSRCEDQSCPEGAIALSVHQNIGLEQLFHEISQIITRKKSGTPNGRFHHDLA